MIKQIAATVAGSVTFFGLVVLSSVWIPMVTEDEIIITLLSLLSGFVYALAALGVALLVLKIFANQEKAE